MVADEMARVVLAQWLADAVPDGPVWAQLALATALLVAVASWAGALLPAL
jgi:hypothetical protein